MDIPERVDTPATHDTGRIQIMHKNRKLKGWIILTPPKTALNPGTCEG